MPSFKRKLLCAVALLFFSVKDIRSQTPVIWLELNYNAKDISGNNNNGNMVGGFVPARDRFNNPCGAMRFDGRTTYIEIPSSPSLESIENVFTFTGWYKIDKAYDNQWLTFFCKGRGAAQTKDNPAYRFQITQSPYSVSNSCDVGVPQNGFSTISVHQDFTRCDYNFRNHLFETGKWNFYCITYDGKNLTAYENNQKIYAAAYVGTMGKNNLPLLIGLDEPGSTDFFEGALDDIRIYNTCLSENQIGALYNESRTKSDNIDLFPVATKTINLPANTCTTKADFDIPKITSTCNDIVTRQLLGPAPGSQITAGLHKIGFEVTENGDQVQRSTFFINVRDLAPPVFESLLRDTIIYAQASQKGATAVYKIPGAKDNCGVKDVAIISGPKNGDFLLPGNYLIRYQALDINNNKTEKEFRITVVLKTDPVIVKKDSVPVATVKAPVVQATVQPLKKDSVVQNRPVNDMQTVVKVQPVPVKQPVADPVVGKEMIDKIVQRKKDIQYAIEVDSSVVKVDIYDNGTVDDDTVTVLYNNRVVLTKQRISTKAISFEITIDPNQDNEITMFADNLGSIPPNTALLILTDGKKRHELSLYSFLEKNGTIIIRSRKKK